MPNKKNILITGAKGQLGQSLQALSDRREYNYFFLGREELDITDKNSLEEVFSKYSFDYCLNFAAYTHVDKAEEEILKAFKINSEAVGTLAKISLKHKTTLIHVSTDYVFDGKSSFPYNETDTPSPINIYGASKLSGEEEIKKYSEKYFIIRTSWLYSDKGNNFFKTMLKLSGKISTLRVVNDQIGTPTLTYDLLDFIFFLINNNIQDYGLYHFSSSGQASWYDFAKEIFKIHSLNNELIPVTTYDFPTIAERPSYSVLSKNKIKDRFGYIPPVWKKSLNMFVKK